MNIRAEFCNKEKIRRRTIAIPAKSHIIVIPAVLSLTFFKAVKNYCFQGLLPAVDIHWGLEKLIIFNIHGVVASSSFRLNINLLNFSHDQRTEMILICSG